MTSHIYSAAYVGFDGKLIEIECDTSNGLPSIVIVGLANKSIDEAKERIRSSLKNCGLMLPRKRITLNLAPADLPKDGASYDLPMAVAVLAASEQIPAPQLQKSLIVGELSLTGEVRSVRGIISHVQVAKQHGFTSIYVPESNAAQAALVDGIDILPVSNLKQLVNHLIGTKKIAPAQFSDDALQITRAKTIDLSDIYGQTYAKRALEIAAAGHHNILMNGPPGAGKTMMARALLSILPSPSKQEIIDITKIHSLAGELLENVYSHRPFRSPHHTSSTISLIGGGKNPKPGEISLAHKGVLFLDELPEYTRSSLESLRQPLEDRHVTIARATETVSFPADFMLVATKNPCPCGYYQDPDHDCSCTPHQINQYAKKISGPLLDRIDLIVHVKKVAHKHLLSSDHQSESSKTVQNRVQNARERQKERFGNYQKSNVHMNNNDIKRLAHLEPSAQEFLEHAAAKLGLSARAYIKTIRVARTIADLEGTKTIQTPHITEALQFRQR